MKKNKTNRKFLATAMAAIMVILIFVALTPSTAQTQPMDPILSTKTVEVKPGTKDVDKSIKEVEVKQGTKIDVDKSIKNVTVKEGTKADVDKSIKRVEVKQGTKDVDKSNNKPVKVEQGTKDVDKSNKTAKSPGCEDSYICGAYISEGYDPDGDGCLGSFFLEIDADTPGEYYCDVKAFIQASTGESWWTTCWQIYEDDTSDNAFIYFVASEFDISGCEEVTLTIQLYTCDGEYTGSSATVPVSLDPSEVPPCENSYICDTYISEGYDPDGDDCLGAFFLEIDADIPDQYCDVKAFIQASTGDSWWTNCWMIYGYDTGDNAFIYFVASEFDISGCEEVTLTIQLYTCDGEYTGSSDTVDVPLDASEVPPCENSDIWDTDISGGVDDDSDGCLDSFYLEIDADTPGYGKYCDVKAFIQASTGESWWTTCWMIYGYATSDNAFIYFDASDFATTTECEEVTLTTYLYTCDGGYTESSDTVSVLLEYKEPVCEKSYIWNTCISDGVDDDGDGCLDSFNLEIDADTPRYDQYCDVKAYIEASTGDSWWTNCWEIYGGLTSDNAFIHFDASEFATTTECEEVTLTTYLYRCDGVNTGSSYAKSANVESEPPEIHWTYMVYLDGDNNLEGAGIDDFMEMSSVSSTAGVNIVVQFDRIPSYSSAYDDWTTCKRFLVTPGMTPTPANALTDLGECNMGDPNTLIDFVDWAMTQYPADNYALILWNHGSGWKEKGWVPWDDNTGIARGICWDDTNGHDYLTLQETEQALAGKSLSLLGYDACFMHLIEVVYQVAGSAGISVGSEEWEPGDGWPYNTILSDLTGTPTMTPTTLGTTVVQRYIESYGTGGDETQSAVDNGDVSGLVTAVDNLAQVLLTKIPDYYDKIHQARNEAEEFCWDAYVVPQQYLYIDLYHFAELIELYVPGTSTAAQAVMNNVNNAVYAEAHGSGHPDAHGLTIYFPETEAAYLTSYENTNFAVDTHWDEFLKEYYAPTICGNMNVNPTSWSPTLNCGESDNEIVTVSATGGTVEGVTVSKVSGPTWLSLSPTNLGDIASGSSKTFTMTAAPPAGTSGDFTYTVRVSNTCGSPSTRDVSGTITVPENESGWGVRLDVTCGAGTDVAELGLNEAATDGFDTQFDVPEPPSPPPPYQQAYFYYPGNPVALKRLSTSYIPPHSPYNTWPFQVDYNGDASDVTITWNADDIAAVPADTQLFFVADSERINMRTTPSYTFSATTGTYEFEITTDDPVCEYTFELFTGWNMISFPLEPLDKDPETIFGPDYYCLYTWDPVSGSYVSVEEVETCRGYWLLVLEDRSVTVEGDCIYEYCTSLIRGWNMIGSVFYTTTVPDGTETDPADQMYPNLYAWSVDHYVLTQDIEPGVGYWALTYSDCGLCVFPAPPPPPPSSTQQLQSRQIPRGENDWSVRLDVTCGAGTDVAEFGLNEAATDGFDPEFDLPEPPPPPPPYQQAYFYYPENPLVKKLSTSYIPSHPEGNSWHFQLDYNGEPSYVTITWNAADIAAVPADCSLLFVVDSVEIDMLTTPTYTFSATTGSYEFEIRAITGGEKPDLIITEKWLCWPDNCTICYNVKNTGDGTAPACHNTTLYVDGVEVTYDHVLVDLAPGESYTGCFNGYVWTYTPPSDNITVCADNTETVVELDETNNCLTNIWMCGDVNGDGKVTMSDVRKVFNRYLDPNYPLDSPWAADVNCDGKVTMSDVRKVFNRYLDPGYDLNCCCEV